MNYPLISEYIDSIMNAEDNFNELSYLCPVFDKDGHPIMSSGNFAVVFKMTDGKNNYAVKCFTKEQEGREEAYLRITEGLSMLNSPYFCTAKYFNDELFVNTNQTEVNEFPILLMDWIEGQTLTSYICDIWAACDLYKEEIEDINYLYVQFIEFGNWLLKQPFAHGDLKPDNIIICPNQNIKIVDYDGMYFPSMDGGNYREITSPGLRRKHKRRLSLQNHREIGSPDFNNPFKSRGFDERMDDFALTAISLSLKMLYINPNIATEDGIIFKRLDYINMSQSEKFSEVWKNIDNGEVRDLLSNLLTLFSYGKLKNEKLLSIPTYKLYENSIDADELNQIKNICNISHDDKRRIDGHRVDEYGAIYSLDYKILLRIPSQVVSYNVIPGTEIIANGAFDHFDVIADSESCELYEADLEFLYLPKSVKYICNEAFGDDGKKLKEIRVEDNISYFRNKLSYFVALLHEYSEKFTPLTNEEVYYDSLGGKYSKDRKKLLSLKSISLDQNTYNVALETKEIIFGVAQCAETIERIVLPYGISKISGAAFRCSSITEIIMPQSITVIEDSAFDNCHMLKKLVLPTRLESIEDLAFMDCSTLTCVDFPISVKHIGYRAFAYCKSLKVIKFHTRSFIVNDTEEDYDNSLCLKDDCFASCNSLEKIYIPPLSQTSNINNKSIDSIIAVLKTTMDKVQLMKIQIIEEND